MGEIGHSPAAITAQTDRILASPHFARSQTLSRLLRFIVGQTLEGKEQELKEYRLGVDVLDRGADFDPRVDPIVRTQAAKLRARLAEYYASDGRGDQILIAIAKGAYVASFARIDAPRPAAAPSSRDLQSIAVLPFVSMSPDPENEYFADGLTEELINVLTYVPGLRVVARTSVFCFKNSARDVREIGAQLNVKTVLEGSVRKAGNQLRVTAQLIDVTTGYHLLSRTFPRELKDVFAVQEELAGAVVTEIMPQVRPDAPVRNYTADLDAYNLYLQGMYVLSNRFTGAQDSVAIFQQVLDRDPTFAPAWAGLANAYSLQCWFGMSASTIGFPLAKNAAVKAIELDDTIGLAHTVLGVVHAVLHWDWKASEQSFRRAIAVQPSLAVAHQFFAYTCLMPQRRFDEAVAGTERALLLNPFDPVLCGAAMLTYVAVGNYEAAYRQHTLAKQANPNHPVTYGGAAVGYETEGRWEEAIAAYRKAEEYSNGTHYIMASLGHALAKSGASQEARKILAELPMPHYHYAFARSLLNLGIGDRAEAIRWLAKALEERQPHTILCPFDPRFAPLREVPEFLQLLGMMGLTREATA